jgi:hypothetical protein
VARRHTSFAFLRGCSRIRAVCRSFIGEGITKSLTETQSALADGLPAGQIPALHKILLAAAAARCKIHSMTLDEAIKFAQGQFTDGLVLVVGSGLSAGEGIPDMPALAAHLQASAPELSGEDARCWEPVESVLMEGAGLEAALIRHPPSASLEAWIRKKTCSLIIPAEKNIIASAISGGRTLRLTTFLSRVLKPANGLPILTTNYDRLIEVGCEMAGFHVDTTAIGDYAGTFDHTRSCMASCRGIGYRGKTIVLEHLPRAIVLKPHGSIDWYRNREAGVRSSIDLDLERLIITPGLNEYKAGYDIPFDKHRELANNHINRAARFLIIGYGFNDDHLQNHLIKRISDGIPTLILTRTASEKARQLTQASPRCVCFTGPRVSSGVTVVTDGTELESAGPDLWDLGVLTKEVLS